MRLLLSPLSLLSAILLYALLIGTGLLAAAVVPQLIDLLHSAPHLAMLGFLALALSPGFAIVVAHHAAGDRLSRLEKLTPSKRPRLFPTVESWSAAAFGWLVLYGTSVLASLVMLVLQPPELEPEMLSPLRVVSGLAGMPLVSVHTSVWILVASMFYELQRRAKD